MKFNIIYNVYYYLYIKNNYCRSAITILYILNTFYYFTVSDKILLKLYSVFGTIFEKAAEIYESGNVTHVSTSDLPIKSDNRCLLQVKGSSVNVYTLFPNINFCTCKAFR